MKTGLHRFRGLPLLALTLGAGVAMARPLLVPPQNLSVPLAGVPQYEGHLAPMYSSVAIDEGTLLVNARRPVDSDSQNDITGVYIFQRNAEGRWNYAGVLTEQWSGDVHLDGNVATVRDYPDGIQVFERGAAGWAWSATIAVQFSQVFRVDDGSIYVREEDPFSNRTCVPPYQQFRKVNGAWTQVATIGGQRCDENLADVNDGRAIVVHRPIDSTIQPPAEIFAASGSSAWAPIGTISAPPPGPVYLNWFGPWGSVRGDTAYIDRGYLYRYSAGAWISAGRLVEPEAELLPSSYEGKLRGNFLYLRGLERDYELPSSDWETNLEWRVLRAYRQTASGGFVYHARLNADFDLFGWAASDDGRQVAAYGGHHNDTTYSESLRLYVFEVPETTSFTGTQQDTFSSGSFSRWTATAGEFAVATSGTTRVLRQSSLAGEAGAHLTGIDWRDQSIEADMRPLEFAGTGRWFGLVTRRTDERNYYYVTFRAPNVISLRRMRDGLYTEIARTWVAENFQVGRNYRMRLESVGDQHVVFIDGIPWLHAKDDSLAQGHPGVAGYRTRFEVDNVIVSGGTRVLLRLDSHLRAWSDGWRNVAGTWEFGRDGEGLPYYLRQSDPQADVKWISQIPAGYQVVSTRVRPRSYGTANDPWIGIAAHVADESNYYYLTLRRSQQLSLRRLVNGQIQELATVPQALTLGAWHDLRLEIIGTRIRAYVNGNLRIEINEPGLAGSSGRNALLLWKTAADVDSYVAYQP
jgi:hypothetical protein